MDAIVLQNFSFAYTQAPSTPALSQVNWTVKQGEFALLCGNTGSGKTTLLRLLHPALAPAGTRSGTLEVAGYALDSNVETSHEAQPQAKVQAKVQAKPQNNAFGANMMGYVSQHPAEQIVCDSVWHELAFGLESLGTPQDFMRRHVAEVAHYFGIESWLHEPCANLSGGQMQLLNLAAALAFGPKLLLLDEPTAQLDPVAEQDFLAALTRTNRELGITVIVATHTPYVFASCATSTTYLPSRRTDKPISPNALLRVIRPDSSAASVAQHRADAKPFLQLKDAFLRYGREMPWVLRGLNLAIKPGTIHALIGGNGSGKTTALLALAGVQGLQRGKHINHTTRQAYLPQDPKQLMVCNTVAEELAEWQQANGYSRADINAAAEAFGLNGVLDQHPFDTSGGQQQLIALAKLLLAKPDVVLLDEPTKGLDAPMRRLLARALIALRDAGVTVVLATHDLAFVATVADMATLLFDGQDAQTAPPSKFFANSLFLRPSPEALASLQEEAGVE